MVEINRSEREREAVKAERIIEEETAKFMHWWEGMALTPTIQALQQKTEEICAGELAKTLAKMPELTDSQKQSLQKMLDAISNKFLYPPLQYLKNENCSGRNANDEKIEIIRSVFGIHDTGSNG